MLYNERLIFEWLSSSHYSTSSAPCTSIAIVILTFAWWRPNKATKVSYASIPDPTDPFVCYTVQDRFQYPNHETLAITSKKVNQKRQNVIIICLSAAKTHKENLSTDLVFSSLFTQLYYLFEPQIQVRFRMWRSRAVHDDLSLLLGMLSLIVAIGYLLETEVLLLRNEVIGPLLVNQLGEGSGGNLSLLYSYLSNVFFRFGWLVGC